MGSLKADHPGLSATTGPKGGPLRLATLGRLTLLVLGLGLAWRILRYAIGFPIWGDEASLTLGLLFRDYAGMLRPPMVYNQIAPLGYMWMELALARGLGYFEWVLRLPAFLSGVFALLLLWQFARSVLDRPRALLAVAFLAASYYPVRHSTEVKPYAVDMFVGLALMVLAWHVSQRPRSVWMWAALTAASALAVWFSYPSAFVIGGAGIFLAWSAYTRKSRATLAGLIVFGLVAAASFYTMFRLYAGPYAAASPSYTTSNHWAWSFPPWGRPWLLPWWLLDVHAGNMMAYPIGGKHFGSIGTLLLVIAGSVSLWRRGRKDLLLLLLAPLITTFLAASFKRYPYGTSARIMLFMAPALCLLAGVGLYATVRTLLPRRFHLRAVRAAAMVLAGIIVVNIVLDSIWPYKRFAEYQTRDVISRLAKEAAPSDQWILAHAIEDRKEFAPVIDGRRGNATFLFYLKTTAPVPLQISPTPDTLRGASGGTWLFRYVDPPQESPDRDARFLALKEVLVRRLGEPRQRVIEIKREYIEQSRPRLEVYVFPPPPAATTSGT